jgi:purine-binding chemotaxis protein CheW
MKENSPLELPASGMAEDILGQYVSRAQAEIDHTRAVIEKEEIRHDYHLVTFNLDREEYGVEISCVHEIIRATDITMVPGAPSQVRGVINLRGKIIPVVDLRRRFGLPEGEETEFQRIVVVELGEKRLGMLVDSVSQVVKVPAAVVEEIPEEATTLDDRYIMGVGKLEGRLIMILDLSYSLLVR